MPKREKPMLKCWVHAKYITHACWCLWPFLFYTCFLAKASQESRMCDPFLKNPACFGLRNSHLGCHSNVITLGPMYKWRLRWEGDREGIAQKLTTDDDVSPIQRSFFYLYDVPSCPSLAYGQDSTTQLASQNELLNRLSKSACILLSSIQRGSGGIGHQMTSKKQLLVGKSDKRRQGKRLNIPNI